MPTFQALMNKVTVERPFNRTGDNCSMWNARPVSPVLGTDAIESDNYPLIANNDDYDTRIFISRVTDSPMTIYNISSPHTNGPYVPMEKRNRTVVVPYFPANTTPAVGTDGHCEIYDAISDPAVPVFHSFWRLQLHEASGQWRAGKYCCIPMNGTGWGTPFDPEGPRAAGVSTAGGLLRSFEKGLSIIPHVLSMTLDWNGLLNGPAFPATMQDQFGETNYTGFAPMGSLFMLPPTFNWRALETADGRAIARTLMVYGARLDDVAIDTFSIHAEIGHEFDLRGDGDYSDTFAIRNALRVVESVSGWIDANGNAFTPTPFADMNIMAMYGPWTVAPGFVSDGAYNAQTRLFEWGVTSGGVVKMRHSMSVPTGATPWKEWQNNNRWFTPPTPGETYDLTAVGYGDCTVNLDLVGISSGTTHYQSAGIAPGGATTIEWLDPAVLGENIRCDVLVRKPNGPAAAIRPIMIKQ